MPNFYVNKNAQANGDHEVHQEGCTFMPKPENRIYLGVFFHCSSAVIEAKKYYNQVNGCAFCAKDCNTG